MPILREEAETFRLALKMRLVWPDEVIAWADRRIADLAEPPIELIDVAVATRSFPDDLARLLKRLPGPADLAAAAHRVLEILRARAFSAELDLGVVANMLCVYSMEAAVPEAECWAAAYFSSEYECLAYYGTPESLREKVRCFLSEHSSGPGDGS